MFILLLQWLQLVSPQKLSEPRHERNIKNYCAEVAKKIGTLLSSRLQTIHELKKSEMLVPHVF